MNFDPYRIAYNKITKKLHETDDIINVLKDMKYNIDDLSSLNIHEISSLNIDELSLTVKKLSHWLNEAMR